MKFVQRRELCNQDANKDRAKGEDKVRDMAIDSNQMVR